MAINVPFSLGGATVTLAATATSSTSAIPTGNMVMRLTNLGPNKCFVRCGIGAQTAVTTDFPVLSGQSVNVSKPPDCDNVAAICAATETATLYVTVGEGGI